MELEKEFFSKANEIIRKKGEHFKKIDFVLAKIEEWKKKYNEKCDLLNFQIKSKISDHQNISLCDQFIRDEQVIRDYLDKILNSLNNRVNRGLKNKKKAEIINRKSHERINKEEPSKTMVQKKVENSNIPQCIPKTAEEIQKDDINYIPVEYKRDKIGDRCSILIIQKELAETDKGDDIQNIVPKKESLQSNNLEINLNVPTKININYGLPICVPKSPQQDQHKFLNNLKNDFDDFMKSPRIDPTLRFLNQKTHRNESNKIINVDSINSPLRDGQNEEKIIKNMEFLTKQLGKVEGLRYPINSNFIAALKAKNPIRLKITKEEYTLDLLNISEYFEHNKKDIYYMKIIGTFLSTEITDIGTYFDYYCYNKNITTKEATIWGACSRKKIEALYIKLKSFIVPHQTQPIIEWSFYQFIEDLLNSKDYNLKTLKKTRQGKFPEISFQEKDAINKCRAILNKI
jgi:hypothetical protein